MTIETLSENIRVLEEALSKRGWELDYQADLERAKIWHLHYPANPQNVLGVTRLTMDHLVKDLSVARPMVQTRAVLPLDRQDELLSLISSEANVRASSLDVVGRIPFQYEGVAYGLYYIHAISPERPEFYHGNGKDITYYDAVKKGLDKRHVPVVEPTGISLHAVVLKESQGTLGAVDVRTGCALQINGSSSSLDRIAGQIVSLHKEAFPTPLSPQDESIEGTIRVMAQNVTILAVSDLGNVVGATMLYAEAVLGVSLVEGTVLVAKGHRRNGIFGAMRRHLYELIDGNVLSGVYGRPVIFFTESITGLSLPYTLGAGNSLGATSDGRISGNLGAYTATGLTREQLQRGYERMGLTYYISPSSPIYYCPEDQFLG